jgi:hypothetical protein
MKKNKLLVLGLIALFMAGGLIFASCDFFDALLGSCTSGGGCRVMTNSNGDGAYELCDDYGCAVGNVPYPVPVNTNVSCDC